MSTPILHLVTFLVVTPHSDPHVIVDVQVASPSLPRHHNAQTEPRRPIHHNCTSMIMSHLLHKGPTGVVCYYSSSSKPTFFI